MYTLRLIFVYVMGFKIGESKPVPRRPYSHERSLLRQVDSCLLRLVPVPAYQATREDLLEMTVLHHLKTFVEGS